MPSVLRLFPCGLFALGCTKPVEPVAPSQAEYGYENDDDPLAVGNDAVDKLPTSCRGVRCPPGKVCRLLDLQDPGDYARALCLGPGDELCTTDPDLCGYDACQKSPDLCE